MSLSAPGPPGREWQEWKERGLWCPRPSEFPSSAPAWVDTCHGPVRPVSVSENSPLRFPRWLETSLRHYPEHRHCSSPSGRPPEGSSSCRHERIVPRNAKSVRGDCTRVDRRIAAEHGGIAHRSFSAAAPRTLGG